ncbi:putative tetratricopeptide-like helical domain superfamily [Dioscorea sansibarensis]
MFLKIRQCVPCVRFLYFVENRLFSSIRATILTPVGESGSNLASDFQPESYLGIGKTVFSKCSYIWEKKAATLAENSSLQDLLVMSLDLFPETIRRFWRVAALKPEDFLEILLSCGPEMNLRKVDFLWKLFGWASRQGEGFHHLPRSYEIMLSMLIQEQMFDETESLLLSDDTRGVVSGASEMFSAVIQGYADASRMDDSIALYDKARNQGLVPSISCFKALLNVLIRNKNAEFAVRVYMDMIDVGHGSSSEEYILDFVVRELAKRGEMLNAVNMLRSVRMFGIKASLVVLSEIAEGYCKKKDYEDMLNFMREWEVIPETHNCNKITSALCRNLASEEAWSYVQKMEVLGSDLDAVTFGLLIVQSCIEGKLKNGFLFLAECFSRKIKPDFCAYNALISGVFKEGMGQHAKVIYEDMIEKGLKPDLSTFKLLLAGYCVCRQFDEVKEVIGKMVDCGMISLAFTEDALSEAFMLLGLDHLGVKVKRDNYAGLSKAEFFDSLGNGLYLETDLNEYERILDDLLNNEIIPNFDSHLLKYCQEGDIGSALRMMKKVVQWGHTLSLSTFSTLLKGLCESPNHIKELISFLDEMPELYKQLDKGTLNFLSQSLSKNGMTMNAKLMVDEMLKREMLVESNTYTALIMGFCKEENIGGLKECLEVAKVIAWLPALGEIKVLISCLCKWSMIKEVLDLFDILTPRNCHLFFNICNDVLRELCAGNFTIIGCLLLEELLQRGFILDHEAYVNIIKGFIKEQKFAEALGIVDIVLGKNISLSESSYQLFVPLLIRFNRVEEVINLKQSMLNRRPETVDFLCGSMLNHLCKLARINKETVQLQQVLAAKVYPDDKTLNTLLQGYCEGNNFGKACEILPIIFRRHAALSLASFRCLVRQFCAHDQLSSAFKLRKLIHQGGGFQPLILYNILIYYLFQSGDSLHVETLLNEMQMTHVSPDQVTYDFLVSGFSRCGDFSKSVEVLHTMVSKGLRPSNRSLRKVLCYLCNSGRLDEALALSTVMEHRRWKYGSVILNAIVGGLLSSGRLKEAELFLNRIEEKDLILKTTGYELLIKQFCKHGIMKRAVELLNVMLKKGEHPNETSYNSVICVLCASNSFDLALDFYSEMQHMNLKPYMETCDRLIYGLCSNGRTDEASRALEAMPQCGLIPNSHMYNYIIDRYCAENNLDKASKLLHEMQQNGCSPNFETHWTLISNLSNYTSKERTRVGEGFLSRLLCDNSPFLKESEAKSGFACKYASPSL